MKIYFRNALILAALLFTACTQVFAAELNFNESYSIEIEHFNVDLDSAKRFVNVTATWKFKSNPTQNDYLDSNVVNFDIKEFLTNYPNKKTDFWEVINRKLTQHLMQKYTQIRALSIKIEVPKSKTDPYEHYSLVEASRNI